MNVAFGVPASLLPPRCRIPDGRGSSAPLGASQRQKPLPPRLFPLLALLLFPFHWVIPGHKGEVWKFSDNAKNGGMEALGGTLEII